MAKYKNQYIQNNFKSQPEAGDYRRKDSKISASRRSSKSRSSSRSSTGSQETSLRKKTKPGDKPAPHYSGFEQRKRSITDRLQQGYPSDRNQRHNFQPSSRESSEASRRIKKQLKPTTEVAADYRMAYSRSTDNLRNQEFGKVFNLSQAFDPDTRPRTMPKRRIWKIGSFCELQSKRRSSTSKTTTIGKCISRWNTGENDY